MWVSKARRVRESSDALRFRRVAPSGIDTRVRSVNPSLRVVKRFRWTRTALRQFLHLANLPRTMGSEFEGIGVADRYPMPSFKVPGFPPPACVENHPVLLGRLRLISPVGDTSVTGASHIVRSGRCSRHQAVLPAALGPSTTTITVNGFSNHFHETDRQLIRLRWGASPRLPQDAGYRR